MARRIDSNAVQDGFDLYQQYFVLSDEGEWTAIQQGLGHDNRRARRYHWHSPEVVVHQRSAQRIAGVEDQSILNLVDGDAGELQNHMVALTREKTGRSRRCNS